ILFSNNTRTFVPSLFFIISNMCSKIKWKFIEDHSYIFFKKLCIYHGLFGYSSNRSSSPNFQTYIRGCFPQPLFLPIPTIKRLINILKGPLNNQEAFCFTINEYKLLHRRDWRLYTTHF